MWVTSESTQAARTTFFWKKDVMTNHGIRENALFVKDTAMLPEETHYIPVTNRLPAFYGW